MKWTNVRLILAREIRDQLRDRRTLFMISVLPILLYPLLGTVFLQIVQFQRKHTTTTLIVGARNLDELKDAPALFENKQFAPRLFQTPAGAERLDLHFWEDESPESPGNLPDDPRTYARQAVLTGKYDVAVCFPSDFAERLESFREGIETELEIPSPDILYSTASEKSQVAYARVHGVLRKWKEEIGQRNLEAAGLPAKAASPFNLATADVAEESGRRGAAMWSKILPVLLLIWAMTGAFYPAVDLCAGEKERGTLETLLSSPAERSEIVLGKLGTIMLFSMITAMLNLASMGLTGWLVLTQMGGFGAPPTLAAVWLAIALVPVSALFSALCLALAAFAKSTKEGQYYLMPLLLVTMPLVILPMVPGVELTVGNSLIPVTGVVLILRALLEGSYAQALQFLVPVIAVTLACCFLAVRWAVEQFNSESVLFRESERLDVALWVRHLFKDRKPTPTVAAAIFCGVMILLLKFFVSFSRTGISGPGDFAMSIVVTQLAVIAAPAILMTIVFTTSPRDTLLLRRPRWMTLLAAAALALLLHPTVLAVQAVVLRLYPMSEDIQQVLEGGLVGMTGWQMVLLIGLVPAVCEELAFRGFILSGFRHLGDKWRAIVWCALLFGLSHTPILQQSILAVLAGVVIGFVAVQTGSILPPIIFHAVHNCLGLAAGTIVPKWLESGNWLAGQLIRVEGGAMGYRWPVLVVTATLACALLIWFQRLPHPKSAEETRREAMARAWQTDA